MGKPRSVFSNNNIINNIRQERKNNAYSRRGPVSDSAAPTVTKVNNSRYDSSKGTQIPLGDGIHDIGSATKRYNRVYASRFGLDTSNYISITTGGTVYEVGTGDSHNISVNGTTVVQITSSQMDVRQDIVTTGLSTAIGAVDAPFGDIFPTTITWRNNADDGNISISMDSNDDMILSEVDQLKVVNTRTGASGIANFVSFRNDSASSAGDELGSLRFDGKNDAVTPETIQYVRFLAGIADESDGSEDGQALIEMAIGGTLTQFMSFNLSNSGTVGIARDLQMTGGKIIKSSSSTEIGLQITNDSITVGTEGTLQVPHGGAPGTASGADTDFGNGQGCIGVQDTGSGSLILYVRQSDGNWAGVLLTRDTLT